MSNPPLPKLGHYQLLEPIARGGMASVFLAQHEHNKNLVAIKILSRELGGQRDPLARILQEGRIISALLHENIVQVYEYGTAEEGTGFVVMERLKGRSLRGVLNEDGAIAPDRVLFIARQICRGLAAAHGREVYHRDIKPANIMLVDNQRHRDFVKLLDFGIAKLRADDPAKMASTATGVTLGTPYYMSPEQIQAQTIDARSDIYQLGIVMFEMITGELPFFHKNPVRVMRQHLADPPPALSDFKPGVDPALNALVQRCLSKAPEARFQTADALRAAIDTLTRGDDQDRTMIHAGQDRTVVGNLKLPTLGSPADLQRYGRNLEEVLRALWPEADIPPQLRAIREDIAALTARQEQIGVALRRARAEADALARSLETRERPIERALSALSEEKARLLDANDTLLEQAEQAQRRIDALDAEYARTYEAIEAHQSTLFSAAGGGGLVDFRDLFREDIATRLQQMERLFEARGALAETLTTLRAEVAAALPTISDISYQLVELQKSRLNFKAERAIHLAQKESRIADLENERRALERALEHHMLRLGLTFRQCVSSLLEARDGR
ncbi:protein kinase [Myxococcota bacterium]|nr:protein kinase [Myxococcota bacterium]MBU1430168.1 protein kinase [Myxococcota bacterium]MBU1900508.1 protein kinase [Myxococcota bacterium]